MLLIILIVLVLLCFGGGVWGQGTYGVRGWSPLGILLVLVLLLWATGNLHLGGLR